MYDVEAKGLGDAFLPGKTSNINISYETSIILLLLTVVLESAGTILLKRAVEDLKWLMLAYICYFSSLGIFSVVLRQISLSVAYTTWCTLGTISVCLLSKLFYDENISIPKGICILFTIPCVIGMYVLP